MGAPYAHVAEPADSGAASPAGPGTEPSDPAPRPAPARGQGTVIAAVSLGGALGAAARYGASLLWPASPGAFPWTTLWVNGIGCAVLGAFLVVITEARSPHHLLRPFFGTGVLGGFTTFSTYAVDVGRLAQGGSARTALAYLLLTLLVALAAVTAAATVTRRVLARGRAA
ncbi:CrcB family protein [Streptomyces sp. ODS28]|uniref:FluC/FEX family fluoride channel n=1 Tax=Streptomyces sp. ODS28 TaxID=3136688 RepID=UPI0031E79796